MQDFVAFGGLWAIGCPFFINLSFVSVWLFIICFSFFLSFLSFFLHLSSARSLRHTYAFHYPRYLVISLDCTILSSTRSPDVLIVPAALEPFRYNIATYDCALEAAFTLCSFCCMVQIAISGVSYNAIYICLRLGWSMLDLYRNL